MDEQLLIAAGTKNIELVKELLDGGANIEARNEKGKTPLIIACESSGSKSSFEMVIFLLDRGADIEARENGGFSSLHYASRYSKSNSSIETVKLLLDRGANIEGRSKRGWTPLILTSGYSKDSTLETIQFLLDRGANINAKTDNEWTSLMLACAYSDTFSSLETVKLLLDRGANLEEKNDEGATALSIATGFSKESSSLETVKLLLEKGADPFAKDNDGDDSYSLCKTNECRDLVSKYIWKRLYTRDMETAKRYGKSVLSKDVWELILLNKRQAQLCTVLSSDKNRDVLKYFALELGIPITDNITKAKLCGLISRYLAYNKYFSEAGKKYTEEKINSEIKYIKDLASRYNLDRNRPIAQILADLSRILE
jgi:ankyrin repeat protein